MQRQLQELERKTREMRSSMERIAAKEKYQMRQIDEENERRSGGGNERNSKWRYSQEGTEWSCKRFHKSIVS